VRRSPKQGKGWPSNEELKTRISCVQEVDGCVWGAFVFRIEAGGNVIIWVYFYCPFWYPVP